MFAIWLSVTIAGMLGLSALYSDRLPVSSRKTLRGRNAWIAGVFCLAYAVSMTLIELLSPMALMGVLDRYFNP